MLHRLLHAPLKVFLLCCLFGGGSLLLNGGLLRLYSLDRDETELQNQIQHLQTELQDLDANIKRAKDPTFIARQAMDHLDMVTDRDLVFVFAE